MNQSPTSLKVWLVVDDCNITYAVYDSEEKAQEHLEHSVLDDLYIVDWTVE